MAGPASGRGAVEGGPRSTFACLWCGRAWTVRTPDDLEGFAQLCPDCLGKAGDNPFLRFRLRAAVDARAARRATGGSAEPSSSTRPGGPAAGREPAPHAELPVAADAGVSHDSPQPSDHAARRDELIAYYEARAAEYDNWYLRRGRYARGPVHD